MGFGRAERLRSSTRTRHLRPPAVRERPRLRTRVAHRIVHWWRIFPDGPPRNFQLQVARICFMLAARSASRIQAAEQTRKEPPSADEVLATRGRK